MISALLHTADEKLSELWLGIQDPGMVSAQPFVECQNAIRTALALVTDEVPIEDRIKKLGLVEPKPCGPHDPMCGRDFAHLTSDGSCPVCSKAAWETLLVFGTDGDE